MQPTIQQGENMSEPPKLSESLIQSFCFQLRVSGSISTAVEATGIGREAYYGCERQVGEGKGTKLQVSFMNAVDKARGEVKMRREIALAKHFDKHWQALAWWLERKYSDEYEQRTPLPLANPDDSTAQRPQPVDRIVWVDSPDAPVKAKRVKAPAKTMEAPEDMPSGNVERISVTWVTGVYYETLGLKPITGRLLNQNDDGPDAPLVAVITDGYWERRFTRDPRVIGESLRIEGCAVTIVGVSPVESTSTSERPLADITMAITAMPRVPPGEGARMISPDDWMLDVIVPTRFCLPNGWEDPLR
jgi:hypothetical protein